MGHRQSFTDVKITSIMADGIETPPMITETQTAVSDTPSHVETQTIEATLHTSVSETPTISATP